jgi:hypothetical protein
VVTISQRLVYSWSQYFTDRSFIFLPPTRPEFISALKTKKKMKVISYQMLHDFPKSIAFLEGCQSSSFFFLSGYGVHQHLQDVHHFFPTPRLYFFVLYLSENKQQLVPLTA